jgi:hypothetical protein
MKITYRRFMTAQDMTPGNATEAGNPLVVQARIALAAALDTARRTKQAADEEAAHAARRHLDNLMRGTQ